MTENKQNKEKEITIYFNGTENNVMPLCPVSPNRGWLNTTYRKDMNQAAIVCGCFSESTSTNDTEDKALFH